MAIGRRVGGRMDAMAREEGNDDRFLRALAGLGAGGPGRKTLSDILDSVISDTDAERAFLFLLGKPGGFHVLAARNRDSEDIQDPLRRMSHFAISRMLSAGECWAVDDARTDRRFRTEDSKEGLKSPLSIRICPVFSGEEILGGIYLDHRFVILDVPVAAKDRLPAWATLCAVAIRLREQEASLRGSRAAAVSAPPAREAEPAAESRTEFARELDDFFGLASANPDMLDLFDTIREVSGSNIPVLIYGESGTGKTILAQAIHQASSRAAAPFVTLSCGSVPDTLIESELLGHEKGAFTGAESEREGLLSQADGGTFFLDNIEDMSIDMQTRLLRVLEDGKVRPLGSKRTLLVDIRVIAAARADLERLVRKGTFRQDLYYRIKGLQLDVSALRERWEDIPALAGLLFSRHDELKRVPRFAEGVVELLARYHWPGNVRELENEMRRLATLGIHEISIDDVSPELVGRGRPGLAVGGAQASLEGIVNEAEREAVEAALKRFGGNKSRAAQWLSITRKALYRRLRKYGIHSSRAESAAGEADRSEDEQGPAEGPGSGS
jgi:DNA-binding NtrC family response regulator